MDPHLILHLKMIFHHWVEIIFFLSLYYFLSLCLDFEELTTDLCLCLYLYLSPCFFCFLCLYYFLCLYCFLYRRLAARPKVATRLCPKA